MLRITQLSAAKHLRFYLPIFLCALAALALMSWQLANSAAGNELSLGEEARSEAPTVVAINSATQFNWKTKDVVLNMRRLAVNCYPDLLKEKYIPSQIVFGAIRDNRPWWGTAGEAVFGSGDSSILGPAEESRFILNPFMLVGINSATLGIWNRDKITPEDIANADFPFYWSPEQLKFDAKNASAHLTYNVSDFLKRINASGKLAHAVTTPKFSLVAYNARDFGYQYILVDLKKSSNVANECQSAEPARLHQFIHCGGTCGYPGGCNNMSPFTPEIDRLNFTTLPAHLVVNLWKNRPFSQQPADFSMTIDLH